jgi:hypothetical protein
MTIPNPTIDEMKLAPCPFPHWDPDSFDEGLQITTEVKAPRYCQVRCDCGACGPKAPFNELDGDSIDRAQITAAVLWNTREPDPALSTLLEQKRKLEEGLAKCRDTFADYAELHRQKLAGAHPSYEHRAIIRKVERNRALADLCNALLSGGGEG